MHHTSIALVDDHVLLRQGLASFIRSFPQYEIVLEADNGADFIGKAPANPPDIVLLDVNMPRMNGYETATWIREHLPQTRVLVLSMVEHDAAIIRMLRLGARGYLLKDSNPNILLHALDAVRDHGFFINELVSNRMIHYLNEAGNSNGHSHQATMAINLSERELRFLQLACTEKTYKEIADEMYVSPRTIDSYRDGLFEKLQIKSRVGLVLYAIKNGIVSV
ncbi:two component transcriptional regulator, LuxR family [Cnuella takakiae]|uniref:Two component transcriptional regulator, LuxR family n=1 Tax=Cnuella takakiae TaxID=1302690 RepID=A0A1M5ICT5_9BACT|nr:response regulator transcription factor [Cnuella takakiae]OLY90789.1 DNA-binding response regulator [Cnuella takakiae]SHG25710.1 two component transcriptional regulator, LuxR family [Cnuella takakiae]